MDYKTVMVSLALDRPNDACLAVAGDLAERFEARVIGIAASDLRPPLYFADGGAAQKLFDEEAAAIQRRLSELEAEFHAGVEKRAKSLEWRSAQALPVPYVLQQARRADILVVRSPQRDPRRPLRGGGSQRALDAGGPPDHRRAARARMAGFQKRGGGLEGRAGGPQGRIRCAAASSPGRRMSRSWKFPSRAARSRRCVAKCCRRGVVVARPRDHRKHRCSGFGSRGYRTAEQDCG